MRSTLNSTELEILWRKVHHQAKDCFNEHKDESVWVEVVKTVWRAVTADSEWNIASAWSMLELNSIQTQHIDPSLLPISKSTSLPFIKKADLAVAFSHNHLEIGATINEVRSTWNNFGLSQMTDAYTQTVPLQCGFEVKERGGDSNEADMQLGLWSSAGLQLLQLQYSMVGSLGMVLPFVGVTVVGHEWRIHITWKDQDGCVFNVSRWRDLVLSTASEPEIVVLFRLLRRICDYLTKTYWPWLSECILKPLSL
ncbi:hypothetical protein GQ44DRAFT_774340 [Phaeosphaeriaceae sp. PMI808]|nr:hypothetical protein GQ44DRAFT_774340 [Phaeosphaeriaceae sp. PMI808]